VNNGYLGMVRQWQEFFFEGNYSHSSIPGPDYVALSKAHGVEALRVTCREDVRPAIEAALTHDGPFLIEFVVEPKGNVFPMVPPGSPLSDMMLEG